eukprot:COSAG02_NODE_589_length_19902_cov_119.928939_10_plen_59_part_00
MKCRNCPVTLWRKPVVMQQCIHTARCCCKQHSLGMSKCPLPAFEGRDEWVPMIAQHQC